MTFEELEFVGTVLGVLLAVAAMFRLLVATVKWLRPRIRTVFKNLVDFDSLDGKIENLAKATRKLEEGIGVLLSEMKPNGGSSLKDQINRIENRQLYLDGRSKAMLNEDFNGVFETDEDGRCNWVNRRFIRMTGRSFEELRGHGWHNIIHPEDRERVEKEWDSAIAENRAFMVSYRMIHPDRDPVIVRTTGHRIQAADYSLGGYTVIVTCLCNKGLPKGKHGLWCGWNEKGATDDGPKPCD